MTRSLRRLDPPAFTEAVAHALQTAGMQVAITSVLMLALSVDSADAGMISLDHYYAAYCTHGNLERSLQYCTTVTAQVVQQYQAQIQGYPDLESIAARILPRLSAVTHVGQGDVRVPLAHTPWLAGLVVAYVLDDTQSMSYITSMHLAHWQVLATDLHARAIANLQRFVKHRTATRQGSGATLRYIAATGDGYDAARILLPDLLNEWQRKMRGDMIIAIPHRDLLMTCSHTDHGNLQVLRQACASQFRQASYPLTPTLFRWRSGTLTASQEGIVPTA